MNNAPRTSVLCVDDEPGMLRSLRWLLQERFDVRTCSSPLEALERVQHEQFHVVVSDQRMPGMTGTEFLARVKALQPAAMRLLLTGYSDFSAVLQCINESEAFRFINKPWDNDELVRIVSEAAHIALSIAGQGATGAPGVLGEAEGAVLVLDGDCTYLPAVKALVGRQTPVHSARRVDEAAEVLSRQLVAVMVCESFVAGESTLPLINWAKHNHPQIVTLVCSGERDAKMVRRLINEGQIFRFLPKPTPAAQLGESLRLALDRHWELLESPRTHQRFAVQDLARAARPM